MSESSYSSLHGIKRKFVSYEETDILDKKIRKVVPQKTMPSLQLPTSSTSNVERQLAVEIFKILRTIQKEEMNINEHLDSSAIDLVIEVLVSKLEVSFKRAKQEDSTDLFTCHHCLELLYEPVTLACGHSFCKKCVFQCERCKVCKSEINKATTPRVNVFLNSILQQLHPTEYVGRSLTNEGDNLMKDGLFNKAILKYTRALQYVRYSHVACLNRAKAHAANGDLRQAHDDAHRATLFAKLWPKAYYTKGNILLNLGEEQYALLNFLFCLALDPTQNQAIINARQIVRKVMNAETEELIQNNDWCMDTDNSSSGSVSHPDPNSIEMDLGENEVYYHRQDSFSFPYISITETSHSANKSSGNRSDSSNCILEMISCEREKKIMKTFNVLCEILDRQNGIFIKSSEIRVVSETAIQPSDFECSLCMRVHFEPTCTSCGHVFCRECIERSLDHSVQCPLCKTAIHQNIKNRKLSRSNIDFTVEALIKKFLPEQYLERVIGREKKITQLKQKIPLFVCTVAFPSVPCPLHIYEPRYRLMLRRAMDLHNNEFGICCSSKNERSQNIGTILRVENVSATPDGRSVVESIGLKRFEIVSREACDGYDTAAIEYIIDEQVEGKEKIAMLNKLNVVYGKAKTWHQGLHSNIKEQIKKHFGDFPEKDETMGDNGPNWTWWLLAVLPVEDKIKIDVISKRQLKGRLHTFYQILRCLEKKRSASA